MQTDWLDRISAGWKAWVILFVMTFAASAPGVFTLPALDRDESRFAQASKQMLETGDYIRIRYQDRLRNKKPAGIHWLQAGSTAALSAPDARAIWSYRVPSWIGVALATLATFWAGIALVGRRAAFLGAGLFGATLLLTSEGHVAKTDGVLISLTTLGVAALAHLYMRADNARWLAVLFWAAMGLGFLIKGPVTPMVAGFVLAGLWLWDAREAGWMRAFAWWPGPVLFVALVLPWFTWIQLATSGAYLEGAVGKDLKDKLVSASEGHGGWPGYHLMLMPVLLFPATLFLLPAIGAVWRGVRRRDLASLTGRAEPGLKLLVVWAVPTWIFFEFLPTKLSHYILPAYPGLALMCGYGAVQLIDGARMAWLRRASAGVFFLGGALLLALSHPATPRAVTRDMAGDFTQAEATAILDQWITAGAFPIWVWSGAAAAFLAAIGLVFARRIALAALAGIVAALTIGVHVRVYMLPAQSWLAPTETARAALGEICALPGPGGAGCHAPGPARVNAVGYSEPSYVFRLGTQSVHPPQTVIALPEENAAFPVAFLLNLEDPDARQALQTLTRAAARRGLCTRRSSPHYAINYSRGDPVAFVALRFDAPPCATAQPGT